MFVNDYSAVKEEQAPYNPEDNGDGMFIVVVVVVVTMKDERMRH